MLGFLLDIGIRETDHESEQDSGSEGQDALHHES